MKNKIIRGLVLTGMTCLMLTACGSEAVTDTVETTDTAVSQDAAIEAASVTEIAETSTPMAEAVTLTAEDFVVSILDDGTAMLTQYSGDAESVIIPSEVSGMAVTVIGEDAFVNHDELKSVVIPDTVVEIRDQAFFNCSNIVKVTMSKNIEKIGVYAFSDMQEIELPDTLKEIGEGAFGGCSLSHLIIPKGLEKTGVYAFGGTNIEELIVPSNIKVIERAAFQGSQELKNVIIESGVEVIEENAFKQCEKLESVTIPESVIEMTDPFVWSDNVTIYTPAGSYAETWAAENGVPCVTQ